MLCPVITAQAFYDSAVNTCWEDVEMQQVYSGQTLFKAGQVDLVSSMKNDRFKENHAADIKKRNMHLDWKTSSTFSSMHCFWFHFFLVVLHLSSVSYTCTLFLEVYVFICCLLAQFGQLPFAVMPLFFCYFVVLFLSLE